jgi:hypothetical protein
MLNKNLIEVKYQTNKINEEYKILVKKFNELTQKKKNNEILLEQLRSNSNQKAAKSKNFDKKDNSKEKNKIFQEKIQILNCLINVNSIKLKIRKKID